jgi:hypothetical protein
MQQRHVIGGIMNSFSKLTKSLGMVLILLAALAAGITGCSSGGSASLNPPVDEGDIVISLTDAEGDFVSYTVDVLSLNLTKANGAVVQSLPVSTRVDFAQYTDMTEFLTAATVPAGTYVKATLRLDYQNTDIWVENDSGDAVKVTHIVDGEGNPISELEVSVQLEGLNSLTILPGIPAHLMLDFDLQASNEVDFSNADDPVLKVEPFLAADVDRADPHKIHRIRGLLEAVNLDESSFSVVLRPFFSPLSSNHRLFGIRSVLTDADTVFQIDGEVSKGPEGLRTLAGLDPLSPVAALGSLKFHPLRFEAWEVRAGTSVPGAGLDAVSGWVTRREGDMLTVRGASLIRANSSVVFNDEVRVQIADTTLVTRQVSSDLYSKDDISIGQHITAFGTLTSLAPENLEMDATNGLVHMMMTTIRGIVLSADAGDPPAQLVLDLQSIGKFRAGAFDFTGTGADQDADPQNYEVFTGTMDLSEVAPGTAIKLKGFVEPFGMAPPDFSAFAIVDVSDLRAVLRANWVPATDAPFLAASGSAITLNLEGTGWQHYLVRGNVVTDLLDLELPPVIAPDGDGAGLYVLKYGTVTEAHATFGTFVERAQELLGSAYKVKEVSAIGLFDDATSTLTTGAVEIRFTRL